MNKDILKLNTSFLEGCITKQNFDDYHKKLEVAHDNLNNKKGAGKDFLGWVDLPINYDKNEVEQIKKVANDIRQNCEILVVIGIGGSYLGSKSGLDFIKSTFYNEKDKLKIYFAGQNISGEYLNNIMDICEGKEVSLCVISKSGTTTETSIAFRFLRELLLKMYGKEKTRKRIFAITDKEKGVLLDLCKKENYTKFIIPDNVGGRFSVLTPVGLLPLAAAGCDIDKILQGAKQAFHDFSDLDNNICYKYAVIRNILLEKNKFVELMVSYDPDLKEFSEWFKQLFGESEGKGGKGIFPCSVLNSTDLHSLGQFIQDGNKILFETVLSVEDSKNDLTINEIEDNFDELNYLDGKTLSYINKKAMDGTILAHLDGDVPNMLLNIKNKDEFTFGYLVYFFMKACGISGHILGVNPFNQPGVEDYKKNMFALLGKEGYEKNKEELEQKLKSFVR
ncbi:MAG: glucose-6-phosphate isomerase [Oscillospiraceae bacterium]